jgi:cholesterol oxidase
MSCTFEGDFMSDGTDLVRRGQKVSRRLFVGGTALTGLGVAAGAGTGALKSRARAASVPTTEIRVRAVVVGSGFGGGVTALRLGLVGVSTLVLERGVRWPTGPNATTFPTLRNFDRRTTWLNDRSLLPGMPQTTWRPYTGLIETRRENGMTVNVGAAVGGGSLMYHGMTLQPTEELFAKSMPFAARDYTELNLIHYPAVARMLGVSTIPDDILASAPYASSRLFLETARAAGLDPFRVPLPVDWRYVRGELDGRYAAAYTNSDIAFGVNNGGKKSIDVTYLAAAERTGRVTVAPLHVVKDISLDILRNWVLDVERIDTDGVVQERKKIITNAVFLNAGSIGTTRLLVKARAKRLIPDLPDAIGTQWGTNGDRIYAWINMNGDPGGAQGGPASVGGRDPGSPVPLTVIHAGSPVQRPGVKLVTLVGFGIIEPVGTWAYDSAIDDARLTWSGAGDAELLAALRPRIDQFAKVGGGIIQDTNAQEPSTWHSLGGVPMGAAVDRYGRVLGQRGLYVLDGARIPGSTGACNPSMTIAALAEQSMGTIIREDLLRVF